MIATIQKIECMDEQEMLDLLYAIRANFCAYHDKEIYLKIYDLLADMRMILELECDIGIPESEHTWMEKWGKNCREFPFDF